MFPMNKHIFFFRLMYSMNKALDISIADRTVTWSKDDFCAACYSVDKKWYRGVIDNVLDDQYQVM